MTHHQRKELNPKYSSGCDLLPAGDRPSANPRRSCV